MKLGKKSARQKRRNEKDRNHDRRVRNGSAERLTAYYQKKAEANR